MTARIHRIGLGRITSNRTDHPPRAARGILIGSAISAAIWIAVIALVLT